MKISPVPHEKVNRLLVRFTIISSLILISTFLNPCYSQIAVNADGSDPNSKAMLDVSSETMGVLIPRMTTTQRNSFEATLSASETGMMVFDTDLKAIYFYNGTQFQKIGAEIQSLIADTDNDTKVDTEHSPDSDIITMEMNGNHVFSFEHGRISVFNTNQNVAIGNQALKKITQPNNIAIGDSALSNNASTHMSGQSQRNIAIGTNALGSNTFGFDNIAIGYKSIFSNLTSVSNTALGNLTLHDNTTGSYNTAIGYKVLQHNITGSYNTSMGLISMISNTEGLGNSAVGHSALNNNTTGDYNTALGKSTAQSNETGDANIAIGAFALYRNKIHGYNVAIGDSALFTNGYIITDPDLSVKNTAVGSKALLNNSSGYGNTALGYHSQTTTGTGYKNTSAGAHSLEDNTEGRENTVMGFQAMMQNTDGEKNAAFGYNAMLMNTSGDYNTAFGGYSLPDVYDGIRNIGIGYLSGDNLTTGNKNIYIGYNIQAGASNESNKLNIGNFIFGTGFDGMESTISDGKVGIGIRIPESRLDVKESMQILNDSGFAKLTIDGSSGHNQVAFEEAGTFAGSLGYNTTFNNLYLYENGYFYFDEGKMGIDEPNLTYALEVGGSTDGLQAIATNWINYVVIPKNNSIRRISNPLSKISEISGYSFETNNNHNDIGLLPEELKNILPEVVFEDNEGNFGIDYGKLTPLLIEAIKEQQKQIKMLEKRIENLEN